MTRALLAGAALVLVAGCNVHPSGGIGDAAAPASPDPAAACAARSPEAGGDLIIRTGTPPVAQLVGDGYSWNATTGTCQPAVTFLLATADPGVCTQVALAYSNPGYPLDRRPAPALHVPLATGGACR